MPVLDLFAVIFGALLFGFAAGRKLTLWLDVPKSEKHPNSPANRLRMLRDLGHSKVLVHVIGNEFHVHTWATSEAWAKSRSLTCALRSLVVDVDGREETR
jgi:hypothetical protein